MDATEILLASASPRRAELLSQIGVRFLVTPQDIDETRRQFESPAEFVARMSLEKARAALAARSAPGIRVVVAADTIVVCEQDVLGKPRDKADALRMLALLSGRRHQVLTSVTVASEEREDSLCNESSVGFRVIPAVEAERYWHTGEPGDKAGAYAIQGRAAVFVNFLSGSYSGVMGLPLFETAQLLDSFDVPRWQQ